MNTKVKELANRFSEFTGTDRYEVLAMSLCKILAGYERYGYLDVNSADQQKIGEVADAMIEEDPEAAFDFGQRLLKISQVDDTSTKSSAKIEANVGLALTQSLRLRDFLLLTLKSSEDQKFFIDRLFDFLAFDLSNVPLNKLRNSPEANCKMMALIAIFELVSWTDISALEELHSLAVEELLNPDVIRAVKFFKGYEDTDYIYQALRTRIPSDF